MSKVYIVMERGWEYNDEYYHSACNGAHNFGRPKRVFTERIKAVSKARELDIKIIKGCNLTDYASNGLLEMIQEGKEEELSQLIFGRPDCDWNSCCHCLVPYNISDEVADKILDCLTIGWYDVVEVDLDD
jgi:hypothetical protein